MKIFVSDICGIFKTKHQYTIVH